MRRVLIFISFLFSIACHGQNICVSVDCKDTVRYPTVITLNGSVTSSDGVKSTVWSIKLGSGAINNVNIDSTFATASTDGLYIYQLIGTSNKGSAGVAFDSVIYFANKPPQAVTGPTVNTATNTAVLSGSGSFDVEGLPLTYLWSELSGPNVATINTPTMSNPIVSGLINGTYTFRLTVTDRGGLTNTATQSVVVTIPVTVIKTVTTVTTYYSDGTVTTVTTSVP
jgi:hypothetical protein